jgi:hypothetical protein
MGVNEIFLCFIYFYQISVKFGTGGVHKNLLIACEFHEKLA